MDTPFDQSSLQKIYEQLFLSIQEAFGLYEILRDESGSPVDFKFLLVNPALESMTGLKKEQLVDKTIFTLFPQSNEIWKKNFIEVSQSGEPRKFGVWSEVMHKYLDAYLYKPNDHQLVSIISDVTKKEEIIHQLKEKEKTFQIITEQTGQMVYDYNVTKGTIIWTGAVESLTGYTQAEYQQIDIKKWEEMIHPDERKLVLEELSRSEKEHRPYHIHYHYRKKDGSYLYVDDHGVFLYDDVGQAVRMLGTLADDTEKEEAVKKLVLSEERFKILFEKAPEAYSIVDSKGVFVDSNMAALKLIGLQKEELIGKNLKDVNLLPLDEVPKAFSIIAQNLLGQPAGPVEFTIKSKEGTQIIIELMTYPVMIQGEKMILGITRDITKRKQIEAELVKRNQELESLNKLMVGRELKMAELKKEIETLKQKVP